MLAEIRTGNTLLADGSVAPARASRIGALAVGDAQGRFYEQSSRGNVFSLCLATASTIPAGNVNAAAAAALTNFAVWNPTGSGKNLSLLKFSITPLSGTLVASSVWHSYSSTPPTIATSVVNPITCNNPGMAAASVARAVSHATTGVALTGSTALQLIRAAGFAWTAGTFTNLAMSSGFVEAIDGDIVIPPGICWVPTFTIVMAAMVMGYSVTWEEIPV